MSHCVYPQVLRDEYAAIVSALPDEPTDDGLVQSLIVDGEWTREGATVVVRLARQYGTFVLRSALALAEALDIEDGEAGF